MICPLLHAGYFSNPAEIDIPTDCLKEECAWYLNGPGKCAVTALADAITNIAAGQGILVHGTFRPTQTGDSSQWHVSADAAVRAESEGR